GFGHNVLVWDLTAQAGATVPHLTEQPNELELAERLAICRKMKCLDWTLFPMKTRSSTNEAVGDRSGAEAVLRVTTRSRQPAPATVPWAPRCCGRCTNRSYPTRLGLSSCSSASWLPPQ